MVTEITNLAQEDEALQQGVAMVRKAMASTGVTEADLLNAMRSRPDIAAYADQIAANGGIEGLFAGANESLKAAQAKEKALLDLDLSSLKPPEMPVAPAPVPGGVAAS